MKDSNESWKKWVESLPVDENGNHYYEDINPYIYYGLDVPADSLPDGFDEERFLEVKRLAEEERRIAREKGIRL